VRHRHVRMDGCAELGSAFVSLAGRKSVHIAN
jgi:hypothetical protein